MALKKTLQVMKFGTLLTFTDAYLCAQSIFVEQARVQKRDEIGRPILVDGKPVTEVRWQGQCELLCFTSREAKYDGADPFERIPVQFVLNLDNQNTIHQFVYGLIKQDPRFADAEDV